MNTISKYVLTIIFFLVNTGFNTIPIKRGKNIHAKNSQALFDKVKVENSRWIMGNKENVFADCDTSKYPFASIKDEKKITNDILGEECLLEFELKNISRNTIDITEIDVQVIDYKAINTCQAKKAASFKNLDMYYAEIDKPYSASGRNIFKVTKIIKTKKKIDVRNKLSLSEMESGKSEKYLLRINTHTEGLYRLKVNVKMGGNDRLELPVGESAWWYFGT